MKFSKRHIQRGRALLRKALLLMEAEADEVAAQAKREQEKKQRLRIKRQYHYRGAGGRHGNKFLEEGKQ